MLEGREFQADQIFPALYAAQGVAVGQAEQDVRTLRGIMSIQVDEDSKQDPPPTYRASSPIWQRVDAVLQQFAGAPDVLAAVSTLPVDESAPQKKTTAYLVAGGLIAAAVAGFLWIQKKGR